MTTTRRIPGCEAIETIQTSKRVHQACMRNLALYLQGQISYEDWRRRQEELESMLTPAPELPFVGWNPKTPQTPEAA